MEQGQKDLKEVLKLKVTNSLKEAIEKNNTRIQFKDISEIKCRKVDDLYLFSHQMYNKKDIEFLNEGEDTDFLIFENNGVYINYSDELFTFHKIDEEEKLVDVDLDNNEFFSNSEEKKQREEMNEDLSEEIASKNDLITLNYFPLCISHSNLTICCDQNFPQVLSDEFIIQCLQIFMISPNPSLRCGYDSLGAGCIINHLHFEILYLDDFPDIKAFPIENCVPTPVFATKLVNKNEEEISIFDGNIQINLSFVTYPILAWKIEAVELQSTSLSSFQNSIANCVYSILSDLIANEIPHNLLISDRGHTIYVIPRKFLGFSLPINTCWNDLSGLITLKDESTDEEINKDFLFNSINSVSLGEDKFQSLTDGIMEKFDSLYLIEKLNQ